MWRQVQAKFIICLSAVTLMGCEPVVHHRGHVEDAPMSEKITEGETTRDDVQILFGSPSSTSGFGEETWYYIHARKEAKAFLRPQVTEQRIMQIIFDSQGVVEEVKQYDLEDGKQVSFVEKTTPTEGHSLGFMEQILGNLGRFNKDSTGPGRR